MTFDPHQIKSAKPLSVKAFCERMEERGTKVFRSGDGEYSIRKASAGIVPREAVTAEFLRPLVEARGMPWDERYLDRVQRYWGSDQRVDGHGDIVMSRQANGESSWDFTVFEDNSPMPWSHNWAGFPVGKVLQWGIEKREDRKYAGPALRTLSVFGTNEMNPICDHVNNMVKGGLLPGCSVGFMPIEIIDVTDEADRRKLGLGRFGLIFARQTLLELSPTTIPANPGAITFSLFKGASEAGLFTIDGLAVLRELKRQEAINGTEDAEEAFSKSEIALCSVARALWPEAKWAPHKDLAEPVTPPAPPSKAEEGQKALSPEATQAFTAITDAVAGLQSSIDEMNGMVQEVYDVTCGDMTEAATSRLAKDLAEEKPKGGPCMTAFAKAYERLQSGRAAEVQ